MLDSTANSWQPWHHSCVPRQCLLSSSFIIPQIVFTYSLSEWLSLLKLAEAVFLVEFRMQWNSLNENCYHFCTKLPKTSSTFWPKIKWADIYVRKKSYFLQDVLSIRSATTWCNSSAVLLQISSHLRISGVFPPTHRVFCVRSTGSRWEHRAGARSLSRAVATPGTGQSDGLPRPSSVTLKKALHFFQSCCW